jgi:hypothetical protein
MILLRPAKFPQHVVHHQAPTHEPEHIRTRNARDTSQLLLTRWYANGFPGPIICMVKSKGEDVLSGPEWVLRLRENAKMREFYLCDWLNCGAS